MIWILGLERIVTLEHNKVSRKLKYKTDTGIPCDVVPIR